MNTLKKLALALGMVYCTGKLMMVFVKEEQLRTRQTQILNDLEHVTKAYDKMVNDSNKNV